MSFRLLLRACVVLALLAGASHAAFGQDADGKAGPASIESTKPAPQPLAHLLGPVDSAVLPSFMLPTMDTAPLFAEDAARASTGDKMLRLGVSRDLRVELSAGRWDPIPGQGWLWRVELGSKGATAVRAHLHNMNLPQGAELRMYPAGADQPMFGPFQGRGPVGDGDLWGPPVPGERMVLEYFVPGDVSGKAPADASFMVDQVMHNYRNPLDVPLSEVPFEGNCHNDVTCYPAWASLSHAVARIDFTVGGSGFLCTGQLLNAQNGDLTPYFLTANHCISTQASAASVTAYWDFQTSVCGGAAPALGTVPTSTVCTLLSNNATSDYCLMMVEGTLPGGRYWSGWTSGGPSDGTFVTGIHHPGGAFKRISFGTTSAGSANHVRSNWYSGVTEGGSSGSGLFRDDNQRLIGQLHGGPSACGGSNQNDDYGAFSVTYPNISGFLTGGSDDGFEPDNSCGAPAFIGSGSWFGLVVKSTNEDWYNIFVGANQRITISLSFTHAWGDIDIEMYDGCGGLLASSTGTSNSELIDYYNTGGAKNVRLRVHLYSDTRNYYDMSVTVAAFPNLNAAVTPPGYSWPSVPRKTNDSGFNNAPLPATLDGNVNDTWVNWAIQNEGPGTTPEGWQSRLYIDNVWSWFYDIGPNNPGSFSWQAINLGPQTIRGGRHSFTSYADFNNTMVESNESDNSWIGQWVWSPLLTASLAGQLRIPPPDRGSLGLPNEDGFQFNRNPTYAWVTGVAPTSSGDDYDLYVYDDYSGSLSGFSNLRATSTFGSVYTDFVVGHYSGTPNTVYPAAIRYAMGVGNYCDVDQSDAVSRNGSGTYNLFPNQLLDSNRLTDVYEAYLSSGVPYYFVLGRISGSADIAFEIFPGTSGGIYGRGYGEATGTYAGPNLDTLRFVSATTGWHPVVVYKSLGTEAASAVRYNLSWGTSALVDVPNGGEEAMSLAFLGASPNPVTSSTRVGFTLPKEQTVRISIYDVNGRRMRTLADGTYAAGRHDLPWDGRGDAGGRLGAGVYWARLEVPGHVMSHRVVLMP